MYPTRYSVKGLPDGERELQERAGDHSQHVLLRVGLLLKRLGFRVHDLEFWVSDFGFPSPTCPSPCTLAAQSVRVRVHDSEFQDSDFGFRVSIPNTSFSVYACCLKG